MVDLHRHDEYSTFDGFGKSKELVEIAKSLGYTSLGISNHGNTNGFVSHDKFCKEGGIKPILGVECYFKPKLNDKRKSYHLCLFAKNHAGYKNLNALLYKAELQKYYTPIVTPDLLRKYHNDLICTSGCIASYFSYLIEKDELEKAENAYKVFKDIFEDDFYIEIQPYKVTIEGLQEKVNYESIKIADKLGINCILTSDSHYGSKDDFDTYLKMHEIAKHGYDIKATYGERYMPSESELKQRFIDMHIDDFYDVKKRAERYIKNLEEIENKVEDGIFDKLEVLLPQYIDGENSADILKRQIKEGLQIRGKYNKKYLNRCKEEYDIIVYHGFEDYFLIVADYTLWAKSQGINVGPGRGSVCNCEVAYALGITEVDSLLYDLDFRRFLRKDKKKMPDIDLDFETSRRPEVIKYLLNRYKGKAAQISSYGLYKVDNLTNDLAKVCGLNPIEKGIATERKAEIKGILVKFKKYAKTYVEDENLDIDGFISDKRFNEYNMLYDNMAKHFSKIFRKLRFMGTHAAGVAISGKNLLNYATFRVDKNGSTFANYDLTDLEAIHVVKFDILGLKTMESLGELRKITGTKFDENIIYDKRILKRFKLGETYGIFQFDKFGAQELLRQVECDNFEDIVAVSSMNRPGPMQLGMPEIYAKNKKEPENAENDIYWEFTKDTYGTVIYQEQIQQICLKIAKLEWNDADKIMKLMKSHNTRDVGTEQSIRDKAELLEKFVKGSMESGLTKKDANALFEKMMVYSFNKGHGVGYSLISVEEMFYKVYYPLEFWLCKLKAEGVDEKIAVYKSEAIRSGCVIMLPHINGSADYSIRELDGDRVIQEGLSSIKGIGILAAQSIEEYGPYIDFPDFEEKLETMPKEKRRQITKKTIALLKDKNCFEFNEGKIYQNTIAYNSTLMGRNYNMK